MLNWFKRLFMEDVKSPITQGLKTRITLHEGKKNKLYKCPADKWTIGIGHNIEENGLSNKVVDMIFEEDLEIAMKEAKLLFPVFNSLSISRQGVLIEMMFQMGRPTLSKFVEFRKAIANGDFIKAKSEMLDSEWAKVDSPARAKKLALIMEHGQEIDIIV